MFAHFNRNQIWSAYPPLACKDNIKKSHEDLFSNLSYGTLNVQTITNFHKIHYLKRFALLNKDQIWSAYPPQATKENIKKISRGNLFQFELWDLRGPNYHKYSLKPLFEKARPFQ